MDTMSISTNVTEPYWTRGGDDDGYADGAYKRYKCTIGRPISLKQAADKFSRKTINYTIERWGGSEPVTSNAGYFLLRNYIKTGAPNYEQVVPMYAFEITQRSVGTNILDAGKVGHSCSVLNDAGFTYRNVDFVSLKGANNSGLNTANDHYEIIVDNGQTSTSDTPLSQRSVCGILEWSKINLFLRAPSDRKGWFDVQLVKFDDVLLLPVAGANIANNEDRDAFFERMIFEKLQNPVLNQQYGVNRKKRDFFKVIKSFRKEFSPALASDSISPAGQTFNLSMFFNDGKFYDFGQRIGPEVDVGTVGEVFGGEKHVIDYPTMHRVFNRPHDFRDRIFLLVSMTHWDPLGGTDQVFNAQRDGSFDLEIYNKWLWRPYV